MTAGISENSRDMNVEPLPHAGGLRLSNDEISMDVTTSYGPRIRDFHRIGGAGVFADAPDEVIQLEDGQRYRLGGGHRLWVAPEIPALTYLPDDEAVDVERHGDAISFTQPAHPRLGIRRTITIGLDGSRARLDHTLVNESAGPIQVAPWAITMVRRGGTGILPIGRSTDDPFQAERSLVLWPYTHLDDPDLRVDRHTICVRMNRDARLKIGTANTRGWIAYALGETLFVKRATHPAGALADLGATAQLFANHLGGELETLGSLVTLAPGESTTHPETWDIHRVPNLDATARLADIVELIEP